jgi:hypothetical protein
MAEKVLFEFRAESEEDGYRYTFRRGEEFYEVKSSSPMGPGFPFPGRAFWHGKAAHAFRQRSQQKMRKTLDALEQFYRDVYGEGPQDRPAV